MTQDQRFYIAFNVKGSYDGNTGKFAKFVWPKLYATLAEAEKVIETYPIFANPEATPTRGRIVSCSIEAIRKRRVRP